MSRPPGPLWRRSSDELEFDRVAFFSDAIYAIAKVVACIAAAHPRQGLVVAGLQWQMQMGAEFFTARNYFHDAVGQLFGIERADAHAIERASFGDHLEQLG